MTSPESGDLDTDASGDGSHTTDSGRGHSDVGETKCDISKDKYPDINPHGYKVAPHKMPMRTFSTDPLNRGVTPCLGSDMHKHSVKDNAISEETPPEVLYQLQQRGGKVKVESPRDQQESEWCQRDPVRTRAYYRDFPVYNTSSTHSLPLKYHSNTGPATVTMGQQPPRYPPADRTKLLDSNNSTFV